jgi:hypothetical protein
MSNLLPGQKKSTSARPVSGVDAGSLAPFYENPFGWYTPLTVRAVDGLCPAEPMDCYDHERMALDVTYAEEAVRIIDAQVGHVGAAESFHLTTEEASKCSTIRCQDTAVAWYKALFVFVP